MASLVGPCSRRESRLHTCVLCAPGEGDERAHGPEGICSLERLVSNHVCVCLRRKHTHTDREREREREEHVRCEGVCCKERV